MNLDFLEFEQPIAELQAKIEELRLAAEYDMDSMGAGVEVAQDRRRLVRGYPRDRRDPVQLTGASQALDVSPM